MKQTCTIKSHSKGITLVLDDQVEFETLVVDICQLFANSKEFFGEGELILSIEGRNLSPQETLIVIEAIELNCSVKIPLILDESEIVETRMIGKVDKFYFDRAANNAKIIRGNVNSGEVIESETGILVIGDLKSNAKLIAKGDVCVMGAVYGEIFAGEPNDPGACIVAGQFCTDTATIGGQSGEIKVKYRGLLQKKKKQEPIVIKLLHGYFHAEPLSSGLANQDE